MKTPSWLRLRRKPVQPNPNVVTFTVTLDVGPFMAAIGKAAQTMAEMAEAMTVTQRRILEAFQPTMEQAARNMARVAEREQRRQEVRRAGLDARFYVRGGLDPAWATPEARDRYVQELARAHRWADAAAFLHGWVEHRSPTSGECLCWMTPPEMWLSAASLGYGGGYEPGSQWEWNPDCPTHVPAT